MLKRIAVVLTAATVLGLAAPASAQMVYGGGWWGGPYRHYYGYYPHRYSNYYAYYPRRHFHRRHFYVRRSWWGGY